MLNTTTAIPFWLSVPMTQMGPVYGNETFYPYLVTPPFKLSVTLILATQQLCYGTSHLLFAAFLSMHYKPLSISNCSYSLGSTWLVSDAIS